VPLNLTDSSVAFATPITKTDDWFMAVGASFGYASDRGLANSDSWYEKGSVTAGRSPHAVVSQGGALSLENLGWLRGHPRLKILDPVLAVFC